MPNHCKICADILTTGNLCGACLKQPPPFDRLLACFPYVQPVVHFIWSLKFHQKLAYARLLGMCLVKQIQRAQYTCLPHYLIPVPLSFKRLQSRGFNQALEIARPISQALNIPIEARGVRRVKETPAQSGLSVAARKRNMRGAFVAMRSYRGAFVAVVDDVVTTQETVIVLCATLKKAGASRVEVWCAARALSCFAHVPQRESLVALD